MVGGHRVSDERVVGEGNALQTDIVLVVRTEALGNAVTEAYIGVIVLHIVHGRSACADRENAEDHHKREYNGDRAAEQIVGCLHLKNSFTIQKILPELIVN